MRAMVLLGCVVVTGCASTTERLKLPPLTSVEKVELSRYLGTWYEVASFPQSFQKDCTGTTANYTLRDDGDIRVENRCRKKSLDGPEDTAVGIARVVDKVTNSRLEVSFFRPFWGAYWIIDLAEDYSYAVVGHPGRDYLWILSRTPTLPDEVYQGILRRLEAKSYPLDRLNRTAQPAVAPAL
jgi:apolipoprotein D and lipocalin family protein